MASESRRKDPEVFGRSWNSLPIVGCDAGAVGAWPPVEVVSSRWFSLCRENKTSIRVELRAEDG